MSSSSNVSAAPQLPSISIDGPLLTPAVASDSEYSSGIGYAGNTSASSSSTEFTSPSEGSSDAVKSASSFVAISSDNERNQADVDDKDGDESQITPQSSRWKLRQPFRKASMASLRKKASINGLFTAAGNATEDSRPSARTAVDVHSTPPGYHIPLVETTSAQAATELARYWNGRDSKGKAKALDQDNPGDDVAPYVVVAHNADGKRVYRIR